MFQHEEPSAVAAEQFRGVFREQVNDPFDLERLVDELEDAGECAGFRELLGYRRRHGLAEQDQGAALGDRDEAAVVDVER